MNATIDRLRPWAAAVGIIFLVGAVGESAAADASPWDGDTRSAIRLIAGSRSDRAAPARAGIEIKLKAGWHTYWRYPGDAGIPPRFDLKASLNLKSYEVRWPAPQRLSEAGMVVIGYDRDVILPLAIVPQDTAKPVVLRLKLDYAVCEKQCVPAEGKVELSLGIGRSALDSILMTAEARVPKQRMLGDTGAFAIRSVRREPGPAREHVVVDVAAPAGSPVALFAEGPTPDWSLPVPMAVAGAPAGLQRFVFELDGAPPGAKYEGASITLTAVAGTEAIEVATRLD